MTSHVSCATPTRGLRALPNLQVKHEASLARASAVAFTLVLIAVVVEFCISGNALALLGVNYSRPGGSPFVKFHPATYFAVLAAVAALAGGSSDNRGLGYVFSKAPALLLFIMLMIFCTIYASANVGLMGAGIYIDTYISAGALAVAMVGASDRQRAILARMVLILCVVNVMISLAEYVNQDHFIPLELKDGDGKIVTDLESEEFRPSGFYGHPLIGALATAFGLFLVLSPRFRFITTATCFGIFAVGLLGFGGRTALVVTIGLLALRVIVAFGRDFMRGRVNGRLLGIVLLTFSILGPVTAFLLSATPVGEKSPLGHIMMIALRFAPINGSCLVS